jgi:hypothetical protein
MKLNINQRVKIKLTDSGKKVYGDYLKQFEASRFVSQVVPEELDLPMWEFAQIFGPVLYNGNPNAPFTTDNEIELIEE